MSDWKRDITTRAICRVACKSEDYVRIAYLHGGEREYTPNGFTYLVDFTPEPGDKLYLTGFLVIVVAVKGKAATVYNTLHSCTDTVLLTQLACTPQLQEVKFNDYYYNIQQAQLDKIMEILNA